MVRKEEYIDYFRHMEKEHGKIPLGGMAWDDVNYWAHKAVEIDKVFVEGELEYMFPSLFIRIKD